LADLATCGWQLTAATPRDREHHKSKLDMSVREEEWEREQAQPGTCAAARSCWRLQSNY